RLYGYMAEEMVGRSIYEIVPEDRRDELRVILDRLGQGERIEHLETFRLRRDGSLIEVELMVSPLRDERGNVVEASAIARDITHRKQMERSLHQLSIGILKAQDEERRRIAREIHDTTVQKLALLSMNLAQLKGPANPAKSPAMLENSQELASQCVQELRTLSYVLHPPMLDELGLASALKIYVEGIAQRSGVTITTDVDAEVPRLTPEVEMALFRVAQEGLSNVLRHSGSKTARIELSNREGVTMKISDQGMGMARRWDTEIPAGVGVGIAGMNERIKQLGGMLTIDSGPHGTTVTAHVPQGGAGA
ncbi:MAG: PAS domain-containing sensor histidine kinase, partial [Terriglobales bacterium]